MTADAQWRYVLEVLDHGLSAVQEHRDAVLIAHGLRGVIGVVGDRSPAGLYYLADCVEAASGQLEPSCDGSAGHELI